MGPNSSLAIQDIEFFILVVEKLGFGLDLCGSIYPWNKLLVCIQDLIGFCMRNLFKYFVLTINKFFQHDMIYFAVYKNWEYKKGYDKICCIFSSYFWSVKPTLIWQWRLVVYKPTLTLWITKKICVIIWSVLN